MSSKKNYFRRRYQMQIAIDNINDSNNDITSDIIELLKEQLKLKICK